MFRRNTTVITTSGSGQLRRTVGLFDAVVIGLGSMIGAGIFGVLGPAARAAGSGLLVGLAIAALVAYCNATSSARLAARYPASGGTYVYGRERLGDVWGYLAGWGFVVGKTASCAAMALTVGCYAWSAHAHSVAVAAVVTLTAINYVGVQKTTWLTRIIVVVVLAVLAALIVVVVRSGATGVDRLQLSGATLGGVVQSAGLLFFAFAGYARIATLGEEVRYPERTIPRAISLALTVTVTVYALVAIAALAVLGPARLARSAAPLSDVVRGAGAGWLVPVVQAGAVIAALGSLLALTLGVSRTALAMARDHHLPYAMARVHPKFRVPHRAQVVIGVIVALLAAVVDLRGAIGFSSFAVLIYYAVANAAALTLGPAEGRPHRVIPLIGLLGCVVLAFTLPLSSVLCGVAVLGVGLVGYVMRRVIA